MKTQFQVGDRVVLPAMTDEWGVVPEQRATVLSVHEDGTMMVRVDMEDRQADDRDGICEFDYNIVNPVRVIQ